MTRAEFAEAVVVHLGPLLVREFKGALRVTAGVMLPAAVRCVADGKGWTWRVETAPVDVVVHAEGEVALAGVSSPVPLVYAFLAPAVEAMDVQALGAACAAVRAVFPHAQGYLLGEALDPREALALPGFDRVYSQWADEELGKRRLWVDVRRHLMHLELSGVLQGGEFGER